MDVSGRLVVVAGATSASGHAVCRALTEAGARVVGVGRSDEKLAALAAAAPGVSVERCDLGDETQVTALAERIRAEHGGVDGLVNLVGGWRGGDGIPGQTEADWRFLEGSLTALRHTSRAFYRDLLAAEAGRLAIVSLEAVASPSASNANYAALKAAAEAWVRAVADGFLRDTSPASATIFVVDALAGLEERLAEAVVGLWSEPAPSGQAERIHLG